MIKVKERTFELGNDNFRYIMQVNEYGYLENLYFGEKIDYMPSICNRRISRGHGVLLAGQTDRTADVGNVNFEYAVDNRGDFRIPSVQMEQFRNGNRCFDLKYQSHRIVKKKTDSVLPKCDGGEILEVTLCDEVTGVKVSLFYTVYDDVDAIARSAKIENDSGESIALDKAYSFNLDMPNDDYNITGLFGAHVREREVETIRLTHGVHTFDSKRGESSAVVNPFVALSESRADENHGNVYGFNLIYSGNFELNTELDEFENVRINGGISSYDFRWKLEAGECFETPECVLVFSNAGFSGMSRAFHDLYRMHLINKRFVYERRPVVINSWEAAYCDFDEQKLKRIIDNVENTGIDTFVLDDGWFGCRNDDTTSLGDWTEDRKKLPHGVRAISDYCHEKGLKFGLWFEPEMVSLNSDLYRKHPQWVVRSPKHTPCLGRDQLTLDLANREVVEFIISMLSQHIEEDRLDYVKWDMNRSISDNYSPVLPHNRQKEFSHRYVLGLYQILKTITEKYPNLLIESCASGGCRFDAGILHYCPQIWTSDNTDAYARSIIQKGTSYCYPLSSMSNHVSVCPNHQTGRTVPLHTRFSVATFGVLGYELDPTLISEEMKRRVNALNKRYRNDSELILNGDFYRLEVDKDFAASEIVVSKDRKKAMLKVVYGLRRPNTLIKPIKVYGLDDQAIYTVTETGEQTSGAILRNRGIVLPEPKEDFCSVIYHIESTDNCDSKKLITDTKDYDGVYPLK